MDQRAALARDTRERIVEKAIELFIGQGRSATTLRQVGERADVAPGTLRNHFASRDALELAVIERLTDEATLPELSVVDGAASLEERIRQLMTEVGTFLDRAKRVYAMWLREPMLEGAWAEVGAHYGARWEALMKRALGPLADDAEALTVLRAISHPTFFEAMRGGRRSTAQAAGLACELVMPWLKLRLKRSGRRPS